MITLNNAILSKDHLMILHPHLTKKGAAALLEYCNANTVRFLSCYGKGEIMYKKWIESLTINESKP